MIGATVQLGLRSEVSSHNYPQFEWVFADKTQVFLNNLSVLQGQLETIDPDFIFNCGNYTAVVKAETEKELADVINLFMLKRPSVMDSPKLLGLLKHKL